MPAARPEGDETLDMRAGHALERAELRTKRPSIDAGLLTPLAIGCDETRSLVLTAGLSGTLETGVSIHAHDSAT